MANKKKYIKRSADGRFFLYTDNTQEKIDLDKRTKLWLSSSYLFEESSKKDLEKTKKILKEMLLWNESQQKFEECQKIKEFICKIVETN